MTMKKILVTGSDGFIGKVLSKTLEANGFDVQRAVRIKKTEALNQIVLDLTKKWSLNPCEGIDTVFHLAGKAHALSEKVQDDEEYHRVNAEGTRKLLVAAQQAGVQRFIYFSSVKAVGDSELMQDEMSDLVADTPYGRSKYTAEQWVLNGNYIPHPVVIRPCMVYGNSVKGNLPKMISAIARGRFPPLPEVNNIRSMVHVKDVVAAALLVAQTPKSTKKIYIISDGQMNSSRQLYELICQALEKPVAKFTIPLSVLKALARIGDLMGCLSFKRFIFDSKVKQKLLGSAYYSSAKIERELGFEVQYSLQITLPEMVAYLQNLNKF